MKQFFRILLLGLFISSLSACVSQNGANTMTLRLYSDVNNLLLSEYSYKIMNLYDCKSYELGNCKYEIYQEGKTDVYGMLKVSQTILKKGFYLHVSGFAAAGPIRFDEETQQMLVEEGEKKTLFPINDIVNLIFTPIQSSEKNIFDFVYQRQFEKKEKPEEYEAKRIELKADENCPNGQTGKYVYSQGIWSLIDCKELPDDFGKQCLINDDCEYNCIVSNEDLAYYGCQKLGCTTLQCYGIRGRCGAYGNSFGNIQQKHRVNVSCINNATR